MIHSETRRVRAILVLENIILDFLLFELFVDINPRYGTLYWVFESKHQKLQKIYFKSEKKTGCH